MARLTGTKASQFRRAMEAAGRERAAAERERAAAERERAAAGRELAAALAQVRELDAQAAQRVAEAALIRDAADREAGIASETERRVAGLLRAGRLDRDPVAPNPGAGTWASPMPVAAPGPATRTASDTRAYAGLPGVPSRRPASPEERVRWSADIERSTADRWGGRL